MELITTATKTFALLLIALGPLVWDAYFAPAPGTREAGRRPGARSATARRGAIGDPSVDSLRAGVLREISRSYQKPLPTSQAEALASRILLGEDPENRILSKRAHDLAFVRGLTPEDSVSSRLGKNGAAYVKIGFFGRRTVRDFTRQLKFLSPAKSILLDLRGCPGGDWKTAVQFLGLFISSGTRIAQVSDRNQTHEVLSSGGGHLRQEVTLLVDSQTASVAELVAFSLARYRGSRILGGPTRGKRILQSLYPLSPDRLLLLTTGSWKPYQ